VFETSERLARDVAEALAVIRRLGDGRYACLLERSGLVLEDPPRGSGTGELLGTFLAARTAALFGIPEALATDAPLDDVLGGWEEDEFLLAFLNGKAAVIVACPDAERLRSAAEAPLTVLADRLFRWKPAYRLDPQGRGLFVSAPRLDIVVVGRPRD